MSCAHSCCATTQTRHTCLVGTYYITWSHRRAGSVVRFSDRRSVSLYAFRMPPALRHIAFPTVPTRPENIGNFTSLHLLPPLHSCRLVPSRYTCARKSRFLSFFRLMTTKTFQSSLLLILFPPILFLPRLGPVLTSAAALLPCRHRARWTMFWALVSKNMNNLPCFNDHSQCWHSR